MYIPRLVKKMLYIYLAASPYMHPEIIKRCHPVKHLFSGNDFYKKVSQAPCTVRTGILFHITNPVSKSSYQLKFR